MKASCHHPWAQQSDCHPHPTQASAKSSRIDHDHYCPRQLQFPHIVYQRLRGPSQWSACVFARYGGAVHHGSASGYRAGGQRQSGDGETRQTGRQAGWRNGQAGRPVLQIQMFIQRAGLKHKVVLNAPLYEPKRAVPSILIFRTGRSQDPDV